MVRISFYLEGSVGKDGMSAVKMRFSSGGNSIKKPTGVRCCSSDWINGRPSIKRDASVLDVMMVRAKSELYAMREANVMLQLDKDGLTRFADRVLAIESKPSKGSDLITLCDLYSERKGAGTKVCYRYLSSLVTNYKGGSIDINEVTYDWLGCFRSWLDDRGLAVNSIGVVMRSLRALVNYAIEEGVYKKEYPFRRFKIKKEETVKRSLTVANMRLLLSLELEGVYERARDLFLLSFYLVGINFVDLCAGDYVIENDHLSYIRKKTGKRITVPLAQQASLLLERYGEWISSCRGDSMAHKQRTLNRYLGAIGAKLNCSSNKIVGTPLFSGITYYWARHTWATLAAELDIPKETISAAMGHSSGSVTDIYIRFDRKKIDEANRKVIDFVKSDAPTAEVYLKRIEDDRILEMARKIIEAQNRV